ncbi:MAG: cob(I)yrinic acid a,c-diamide adenosyltransferase [Chitinophagales bacterium]|nr:cob(I)yrinic acid a,c-diamide adenosyltransferase [Bacteroidota bacterium]MCB9043317.1 cob(I)yrinic acid a,c-diamide adenosyltransferase [Chitinophagales bacterium]
MKIYTKTGDDATTMLWGGGRVEKHHIRIDAYGTVDELNSALGIVHDSANMPEVAAELQQIQSRLFSLGAILATNPDKKNVQTPAFDAAYIEDLEKSIDRMETVLPPLKNFILPSGHLASSHCHLARCICRRAERKCSWLNAHQTLDPLLIPYLNRLSDYLFVLARYISHCQNGEEIIWKSN